MTLYIYWNKWVAMEKDEVMPRHGKHYKAIQTIGSYPLVKELLLKDLGNEEEMKKVVQACYYEMKKDKLEELSVIDYLCMISTSYLLYQTKNDYRKIIDRYAMEPEEVRNFLRFFMKYPYMVLPKYNEADFKEIAVFWYRMITGEITKKKK